MKIGIISDSHDNLPNIRKALALLKSRGAEALIHTGDIVAPFSVKEILKFGGPVYGVFGNNNGEVAGIKKLWPASISAPFCSNSAASASSSRTTRRTSLARTTTTSR